MVFCLETSNVFLFIMGEWPSLLDRMPFFQTAATAGRRGMLRDEHGMLPEGGLFAVIGLFCRGKALLDELSRVFQHFIKPFPA